MADQLVDEPIDEEVRWRSAYRPYDELRQSGVQVGVELAVQRIPAGGDQLAGIEVWPTPAGCSSRLRRQLAVGDGQRNAEVIGLDVSAGFRRGPFDRLAP